MPFDAIVKAISSGFAQFSFHDAIDILIIALLLYRVIIWAKETRGYQVLKGIALLFICAALSQLFELNTLSWILNSVLTSGIIIIIILFQPELRRVLGRIGRGRLLSTQGFIGREDLYSSAEVIQEIHKAVLDMARRCVGALIVIEQQTALGDIITTGTKINGAVSSALLENIFEPNTPLHDGAVIIRDGVVVAAACLLPLADDLNIARELGTRHRAALGIAKVSDSVTIIVSEETGIISVARDGKLMRYIDSKALKDLLENIFVVEKESPLSWLKRRNKNGKQ